MYFLTDKLWFPDVSEADSDGLLAVGGDLSVERLKLAYRSGIFPWYGDAQPIMWWSPNPRMLLFPDKLHVSKNLQKKINKGIFTVTYNKNFAEVIRQCANVPRPDQGGTWITEDMEAAYIKLHQEGIATSVEVWLDGNLVGGLYGVDLSEKKIFCGESMFSGVSDASKIALYHLVEELKKKAYKFIDCQMYTDHLARMGAEEVPREQFVGYLSER